MQNYLVIFCCMFVFGLNAQLKTNDFDERADRASFKKDSIYTLVDEDALFPGGRAEMVRFISLNLKLPQDFLFYESKIKCKFVVEKNGSITDVQLLNYDRESEELRLEFQRLSEGMPCWIPAKIKGENVRSIVHFPLKICF